MRGVSSQKVCGNLRACRPFERYRTPALQQAAVRYMPPADSAVDNGRK
jgi:hypothetical protein